MRIGHGYDVHAFGPGDQVTLGGVRIAHTHGLVAHSDGDVLLHAVCDALLGAAGLGDIGRHFPDDDPAFKGIDSRILLRRVAGELVARGLRLGNLDATVIAQSPRLAPHINEMVANLAGDLEAGADKINIKATTTERLGWLGRGEGIAAHAVVVVLPWTATWS